MIRPQQPHTFKGEFTNFTTLLLYSFDHHDDLEKEVTPKIDISDIDGLSDIPMIPGMDDSSTRPPDLSMDNDDGVVPHQQVDTIVLPFLLVLLLPYNNIYKNNHLFQMTHRNQYRRSHLNRLHHQKIQTCHRNP